MHLPRSLRPRSVGLSMAPMIDMGFLLITFCSKLFALGSDKALPAGYTCGGCHYSSGVARSLIRIIPLVSKIVGFVLCRRHRLAYYIVRIVAQLHDGLTIDGLG